MPPSGIEARDAVPAVTPIWSVKRRRLKEKSEILPDERFVRRCPVFGMIEDERRNSKYRRKSGRSGRRSGREKTRPKRR